MSTMKTKPAVSALLAAIFFVSACKPIPQVFATATPEFGSGSEEGTPVGTARPTTTPEPVSTISIEKALELGQLGQIAFTASDGGRRDIWLINADGTNERSLTGELENTFAEAAVWSPTGDLLAFDGRVTGPRRDILLVNVDGNTPEQIAITEGPGYNCYPSFSPDGQLIVYMSERDENRDLYIMDLEGNEVDKITSHAANDYEPDWSPDGEQIVFTSRRSGGSELYVMDTQGQAVTRITNDPGLDWRPAWSPDGEWIAFESWRNGNGDIFIMRPDGSDLRQLTDSAAEDGHPDWSSDGRYIVFHSQRTGNYQLFILEVEHPENVWHLETGSVRSLLPVWAPLPSDEA